MKLLKSVELDWEPREMVSGDVCLHSISSQYTVEHGPKSKKIVVTKW